ncbi:MAG: penicillin-binding protein activator LpoB [Treponema sp.]|nr:penicillin-binding protein activator LpoB [Treponema sp.]
MSTGKSQTVDRISAEEQVDLSGYWNDIDVRLVADHLVNDCAANPSVAAFTQKNGRLPVVIVGRIRNQSDEHIDTKILSKQIESALLNSEKLEFVADADERLAIRAERLSQQDFANPETAKALRNELGADYMMVGSIKTIIDSSDTVSIRSYYVHAELIDIESTRIIWAGEDSSIKKQITRSRYRL